MAQSQPVDFASSTWADDPVLLIDFPKQFVVHGKFRLQCVLLP
jgi:hypothetical protein